MALFKITLEKIKKMGRKNKVEKLIKSLEYKELNDVRKSATEALVKIGKPAVEPLIKALKYEDDYVRRSAAEALGKIGDPIATKPLIKALIDSYSPVCKSAAEALGKIGESSAVEPLIKALRYKDDNVRKSAAEALGKIGDTRSIGPLIKALRYKDDNVRKSAEKALGRIGGKEATDALKEFRKKRELQFAPERKKTREMALEWWKLTKRSSASCDWCNKKIKPDQGYCVSPRQVGVTFLGELLDMSGSPDLICEKCFMEHPSTAPYPKKKFAEYKKDYKKMILGE